MSSGLCSELDQVGSVEFVREYRQQISNRSALARCHIDHTAVGVLVERSEGIRGIGPWTRAYYAMRALADPDAFPAGDLVLRKAAHCTEKQLAQRAEAWRPWRAYAAVHLWRSQA